MSSKAFKFFFILTSISPVLLIIYSINIINTWSLEKIKNLHGVLEIFFGNSLSLLFVPLLILPAICCGLISYSKKNLEKSNIQVTSIRASNSDTFSFLLAYLLPLVFRSSLDINTGMIIIFLIAFFVVTFNSHSYHFNPLLGFIGYRCYEVQTKTGMVYTLLTRKNIKSCKSINQIVHITDYMILEVSHECSA